MSETMSWSDRVRKAARRYPNRPYEDNETSYKNLRDTYGFEFDEYLCPIRSKDRNFMVGTFGQEGWWTFWFPTHAEKNNQFHLLREWGDGIAAAVRPRGKAAYELSWSMNVLPFLPEEALALSEVLNEWFVQSSAKNFRTDFADLWRNQMRAAVSNLSAIVTWSKDGTQSYDVKPGDAVQTIDGALGILGLGQTPTDKMGNAMPAAAAPRVAPSGRADTIRAMFQTYTGPLNKKGFPKRKPFCEHAGISDITRKEIRELYPQK